MKIDRTKMQELIIAQVMQPLIERRDYAPNSKDMLEQNAETLKKKRKQPLTKSCLNNLELNKIIDQYFHRPNNEEFARDHLVIKEEKQCVHADEEHKKAIIKRCPKKDQDERPKSEQQWCLYTHDEDRLLGRHPTKDEALQQERVIQIHKHKN